ncbi:cysteine desulfurase NifS [Desulfohalobium retbaense]|uniref:Cysteine desulfurase n=1 Tax=Desulfohalobium retbaense (strain ATCC 49708 / DSM 5692 / JCM 16813 / HR100) TaxID=485915 RepID=C8WZC7_DESRD|nr:cysteine desulfurase NifS [Desulfohalobium retbaense]ACV67402.1 cysteine desulfurase NifS [Desulfohalobium retbaense DSM 5692]
MNPVYLDNNATTRVAPEVEEAMRPYLGELYGNPSSMHRFGGQVGKDLRIAREQVATGLGADPEEIIFTSCGTEGDNTAIHAALESQPDKRHIVTTKVEHPAVLNYCKHLEKKGYEVTYLGVDTHGRLDLNALKNSLRPDTAIVSIMYANNETGVIFPLDEIAPLVKERGILLHTDAVQTLGKIPFSVADLPVDYLVVSGHKVHGPKGVGVLYVRRSAPYAPFVIGGHQEHGRRAGTENTASIIAMGKAVELATTDIAAEQSRISALRDRLQSGLLEAIPDTVVNGEAAERLPNTLSIAFKYIEGEAMLLLLDEFAICASSGSACTSGSLEPSHVLRAMGVPFTYAHGSLRFSLSRYTTEEEIDTVLRELPPIIERLRAMSPFRRGEEAFGVSCGIERDTV